MCGIAGYKLQRQIAPDPLDAMVQALLHRGPDGQGMYRTDGYAAGMRRLSINDVHGGDQPLYNEDRTVVLLYNGEVYNSPALRRELEQRGHRFRTHSDGEVICHLYEEEGADCFSRLDGMFAAALWDDNRKRLLLARDVPGEKPLYYALLPDGGVVFASELKSLLRFPLPDTSLNYQALWDFPTFLWIPEPNTVYNAVHALMPGHLLIADGDGVRLQCYGYREAEDIRRAGTDEADVVRRTRLVVENAVKSRLLADVPVGSFLSGGLDSSIIATIAARELPELSTFTIGFEDLDDPYHGRADEAADAEYYARRLGTKHHTIRVTAREFRSQLDDFCTYGDQPFSVSSGLGILCVARAAREAGIRVLLSGDGADECFGGYSWYAHLNGHEPEPPEPWPADAVVSFQNVGLDVETRKAVLRRYDPFTRAWAWHYYAAGQEKRKLYADAPFRDSASSLRFFRQFRPQPDWQPEDFIAQDRNFYFPNEMLRKVDRMTMAHSVEGRAPFAAPAVLAFADTLRYTSMYRNGTLKWALRTAFADVVPAEVLQRPKHGFNVPVDHWLRNEWRDLLRHAFSRESALFRHGLVTEHSGKEALRLSDATDRLHGHTLFSFIMLNMWLERNT